jgi:iron complex outermembrane receptor protein
MKEIMGSNNNRNVYLFTIKIGCAVVFAFFVFLSASIEKLAYASEYGKIDITGTSLEDLMNMQVTSVSKKTQKVSDAAAAVFVITREDIRRSGATSIPELLRMVPGMDVARISSSQWAVSARGFNGLYANKLLVLIDGRSVYSPIFSGVHWDVQDTVLEDIDRIEVIRGPGATLWGANAVNGVINIITKHAQETQGGLVSGGAGNEEKVFGNIRYGARAGDNTYYRMYTKYFDRDDSVDATGTRTADAWHVLRAGFRVDHQVASGNSITLQGDVFNGSAGEMDQVPDLQQPFSYSRTFEDHNELSGANVSASWKHEFSPGSDLSVQAYVDHNKRRDQVFSEKIDTYDVELQHRFLLTAKNEIVWGLGYRAISDQTEGGFAFSLDPASHNQKIYTGFVQDEITIIKEHLLMTIGSKIEHNDLTGYEIQPSARALWIPVEHHTVWAAVSKASRTPSRNDADGRINSYAYQSGFNQVSIGSFNGSHSFVSEKLTAYELGYRARATERLSLDIATFYNVYHDLLNTTADPFITVPGPVTYIYMPQHFTNTTDGREHGVEIVTTWKAVDFWKLIAGFTLLDMHLSSDNSFTTDKVHDNPHEQFNLRSMMDLPHNLEFDTALYAVNRLTNQQVPGYTRVDARLGWRPSRAIDVSLVGQNLLDRRHPEFGSVPFTLATQVERSYYGKIGWKF